MSVIVEKLPDEPIVVCSLVAPSGPSEYPALWRQLGQVMEGLQGTIYRITDMSQIRLGLGDVVLAIAEETRSKKPGSAADPRIRPVMVTSGSLAQLAARTMTQDPYGEAHAPMMFGTLDAALNYCRSEYQKA